MEPLEEDADDVEDAGAAPEDNPAVKPRGHNAVQQLKKLLEAESESETSRLVCW